MFFRLPSTKECEEAHLLASKTADSTVSRSKWLLIRKCAKITDHNFIIFDGNVTFKELTDFTERSEFMKRTRISLFMR